MSARPRAALFVLLPAGRELPDVLAEVDATARERLAALALRRYPRADDERHLRSLVRAGRDRLATQWQRGLVLAVLGGGVLGAVVNGVLASAFDMLGGRHLLVELALPLGFLLGAFLGGFTAAMTGTEAPRPELAPLWPAVRRGDTLLQFSGNDGDALRALAAAAQRCGFATAAVTL